MTGPNKLQVATIIPGEKSSDTSVHLARGTKVILSDGSELSGITGITLRADAGGLWKAWIEVYPQIVPIINAQAEVEVAGLDDEYRQYVPSGPLVTEGCANVPSEGTFLLERGERVKSHVV